MSKILDKCPRSKERKLLDRTMSLVETELDLVKLISLQKMLALATLSSLSNDQITLIESRSHLVVRSESESSAGNITENNVPSTSSQREQKLAL